MRVLFVNHNTQQCGVYQFGKRVAHTMGKSEKADFFYLETELASEFEAKVVQFKPQVIVYNFYPCTMGWLADSIVSKHSAAGIKQHFIYHDGNVKAGGDKYICFGADAYYHNDGHVPILDPEKTVILPRPLFEYNKELPKNEILTIGSFGFGFGFKGFDTITHLLNTSFVDREILLRLHMPFAFFGDRDGASSKAVAAECVRLNTDPRVKLEITHDFRTDEAMLDFVAGNDINFFHYNTGLNPGISSVLDYALSVKRVLVINWNTMFRHVLKEKVGVNMIEDSIENIYSRGTAPLELFYEKWSQSNFIKEVEELYQWN